MDKDELEVYAKSKGIEIDKRKKLDDLRKAVVLGDAKAVIGEAKEAIKKPEEKKPLFMKNKNTKLVFHANPEMYSNPDLVACDKDGNDA